ncbi:MAG: hypothetical protein AYK18_02935 [Theionarchaea archaeon DG-70]|nr:MAG: hypothetical protein AYK18_02935 [Theionarchaea archaeon DG-70]
MGLRITVPVNLVKKMDVGKIIEATLRNDPKNAYTIMGLMVKKFDVNEADINGKSFKDWKPGQPTLYTKIRTTLEKLKKQAKVDSAKYERAVVYWWTG